MKFTRLSFISAAIVSFAYSSAALASFSNFYTNVGQTLGRYTLDCAHWYVGGNLGVSNLHDQQTPGFNRSVSEVGPGWSANAGYQFNSILGTELGFTKYHDSRENAGHVNFAYTEHYSAYLAATGRYPLVQKLSALGKLGVAYSYANKVFPSIASVSAGSGSLYWGLGLDYSLTRKVDFIAQFARAVGNNYTGSADLYSLGFTFAIV